MQLAEKARIIQQVEPVVELLNEICVELGNQPRTAVATRQLSVIICKLIAWRETYEPKAGVDREQEELNSVPTREEIDKALKAYRRKAYFGLNDREKYVINFFEQHYRNAA